MPRSSSTVDRLFAPAIRLMASMRFSQKAMLIGASFTLTCGVLTALVLSSSLGELSKAKAARAATTGLRALNDAQIAMQEHRALRARALAKDATATPQALADAAAAPARIRVSRSEVARDSKARALGRMRLAIELVRAEQQPGAKVSKMAAAVRMRSQG